MFRRNVLLPSSGSEKRSVNKPAWRRHQKTDFFITTAVTTSNPACSCTHEAYDLQSEDTRLESRTGYMFKFPQSFQAPMSYKTVQGDRALMLWICVREVVGSRTGRDIGRPDWHFRALVRSFHTGVRMLPDLGRYRFLPSSFQFIIHHSSYVLRL
jgi:hypothetical protein